MDYLIHICIIVAIYTMLSQTLSLVAGYSGQLSLAHAGFYGIGAYTTALLSVELGWPFWINLPIAMFLAAVIAIFVASVALRTVDDYFVIITLGIQIIAFSVMNNWESLTRGPLGITSIPNITFFNFEFNEKLYFLLLCISFSIIVWWLLRSLFKSPFGRVLLALSEDEIFTKSMGKNVYGAKITAFTISSSLAVIPGTLYAHYISYIDPTSFSLDESIFILSIVIIGGMRNLVGIFLATLFLIFLPEVLRFVGMPSSIAANVRQIIYGLALILVIYQRNGLLKFGVNTTKSK